MNKQVSFLSFQKVAHFLIILVILTYILIVGKDVIAPIVFGLLLSFMLKPIFAFFCDKVGNRMFAALLTILTAFVPLICVIAFFGMQLAKVITELPDIISGLSEGVDEIMVVVTEAFNLRQSTTDTYLSEGLKQLADTPFDFIAASLSASSGILLTFSLTVIYTFLFLLYRKAFRKLMLQQFAARLRTGGAHMLYEVQLVSKQYFSGVLKVMLILGVLNSCGLYLIGLDFPLLWGFLAAVLAIIPYIGTFLGGLLPFLYSFASGDGYWQPIAIIIMYACVQTIEGNLITPKVVGKSVNINPLSAIIFLFIGDALWGLPGMIVALPLLAILRIVLDHIPNMRPIALALSDDFYYKADLYETKYDKPEYRIINLFKKQQKPLNIKQVKENLEDNVVSEAAPATD